MNVVFIGPISPPVTGPGVKNKYIIEALIHNNTLVSQQNTLGWTKQPIGFLFKVIKSVYVNRNILISVSKKGRIVFSILMYFLSFFINIKYVIFPAGGSLDEEIEALPTLLRMIFEKSLRKSDTILVESLSLQERLENMGFDNISFFPNPRKDENYKWSEQNTERKKILFLSKIREGKGVLLLLKSVLKLKEHNFILEYYGPIEDAFKDIFLQSIEPYECIVYKGIVNPQNVQKVISEADIFVFPTLFDEGLPGVIVEASFTGVPLITSRFKASEEYISDNINGLIVEQNNEEELMNAMDILLNSSDLRKSLSKNLLTVSQQFNIDILIEEFLINLKNKGWE